MAGANQQNVPLLPNGVHHPQPLTSQPTHQVSTTNSDAPWRHVDMTGFDMSAFTSNAGIHHSQRQPHPIMPENLEGHPNNGRNFLDFRPIMQSEMQSEMRPGDQDVVFYRAWVRSLRPEGQRTVEVFTEDGCIVECSTVVCQGLGRLRVAEIVQIAHHLSGEHEGQTFAVCVGAECTPIESLVGSRSGSRAPSPPPMPPES